MERGGELLLRRFRVWACEGNWYEAIVVKGKEETEEEVGGWKTAPLRTQIWIASQETAGRFRKAREARIH